MDRKQNCPEKAALLTRHQKQRWIEPVLEQQLGWRIELTEQFDTDQLGTFSGEVERSLSPLDCARRKAQLACELTGLSRGLGSEGSFGEGPYGPWVPWQVELLVCIDLVEGWEVVGMAQGPSCQAHQACLNHDQALVFQAAAPKGQGLILYPDERGCRPVFKGIQTPDELRRAFEQAFAASKSGMVMLEYDLRAHQCPARQESLAEAARDLSARLSSCCPGCHTPGFWHQAMRPGLPCRDCGAPTGQVLARVYRCQQCKYEQERPSPDVSADPFHCPFCNP